MASNRAHNTDIHFARLLSQGEPLALFDFEARYRPIIAAARARVTIGLPQDDVQSFVRYLFEDGGRQLHQYRGECHFASWIFVSAHRFFYQRVAQQRLIRYAQAPSRITPLPVSNESCGRVISAGLRTAVHNLPPVDRLYIRLVYVDRVDEGVLRLRLDAGNACLEKRDRRVLTTLQAAMRRGSEESMSLSNIREHLMRLDLRLEPVGQHLKTERIAAIEAVVDLSNDEMAHLASCDECLAGLLALKKESPHLGRTLLVRPKSYGSDLTERLAKLGMIASLIGLGWMLKALLD